jgi:Alr-MurF fusion protein
MLPINTIAELLKVHPVVNNTTIEHLCIDSRRISKADTTLFFAISATTRDGHKFIESAYKAGVRNFVISNEAYKNNTLANAQYLLVANVIQALQTIGKYCRSNHNFPVIGITGSNGKTIVKEWLWQICNSYYNIVRSPQSYNSQIGVPLSLWKINGEHNLGIFEVGISEKGDMPTLADVVNPTIGIFTHLGNAHLANFENQEALLNEKWQLFTHCSHIITEQQSFYIPKKLLNSNKIISWGAQGNFLKVNALEIKEKDCTIETTFKNEVIKWTIPFTNKAFIDNCLHVITTALFLKIPIEHIQKEILLLQPPSMRLSLQEGINQCKIINDAYTNDIEALHAALELMYAQKDFNKKTIILSALQETINDSKDYKAIIGLIKKYVLNKVVLIGTPWQPYLVELDTLDIQYYSSTDDFLKSFIATDFYKEIILLKGARKYAFEGIAQLLSLKKHETWVAVNLSALNNNVKKIKSSLPNGTATMAMVKANSYGSGTAEIAATLSQCDVQYLAVAYSDEAVLLRNKGVNLPIMVMNPSSVDWATLLQYNIEPEIYSLALLQNAISYCQRNNIDYFPLHLKIDTGMRRLGFEQHQIEELALTLKQHAFLNIKSLFTHLAAADDDSQDEFTTQQFNQLIAADTIIKQVIPYEYYLHAANSAGLMRFGLQQCNMVRLGLAMYGYSPVENNLLTLEPVLSFYTTVAQIKKVQTGESVGYGRSFIAKAPTTIATVRVGYADGYPRNLSNGVGYMLIHGQPAKVCGRVCMDMVMLDITHIPNVLVGDVVTIFGEGLPANILAKQANTITYEIIAGISSRVNKIFIQD